jgi:pilus assembly protein CpaC
MNRRAVCLLILTALAAIYVVAQSAVEKEITLVLGKGELIQYKTDVNKVVIAEPKIADALVVSPTEVMVNAKGVGHTTLVVWEANNLPVKYNINVVADRAPIDNFNNELAAEMKAVVPDGGVIFNGNSELIVLTGKVADAEYSKKAEALAGTRAKKVINLLEVPALADPRQILLQVKFASVDRVGLSELGFNLFSRNGNTLGALGTQQFQGPRFSQLQFQNSSSVRT